MGEKCTLLLLILALPYANPIIDTVINGLNRLYSSSGFRALLPHRGQWLVQVMPDDHSKLAPPLPIPNRTVKQLCADDSAATSVKVGYRQASYIKKPLPLIRLGLFFV